MLCLTFVISRHVAAQTPASCDGTTGNDIIVCAASPSTPDDQIDGDLGDDHITQNAGVTSSYIDADGAANGGDVPGAGNGGNDTIINNGTLTRSISGDFVTGIPGDDTITNNGTIEAILGDETHNTTAPNGDDIIVNNGTITDLIKGDGNDPSGFGGGNGGNDTITNNSIVGGNIYGDSGSGIGGNDVITNNGSVGGSIDTSSGNDTVIIGAGATVTGLINGGLGTDSLQFKFNDSATQAAAAAALAGKSPVGGTATFGGHTYTWQNFESIVVGESTSSPTGAPPTRNYFTISTPTLTWNRVTGAATYEIQVDNTQDFSSTLDFVASVASDQLSVPTSALTNTTYYWRVRACPSNGPCSAWSATDSFVVNA